MKILHINQTDISGGASLAAYRLHEKLLEREHDSRLLVGHAHLADSHIARLPRIRGVRSILNNLGRYTGLNYAFLPFGFNATKHWFFRNVDIVNLHNLHSGYFNYLAMKGIATSYPTVFTLHDMWSFTGHCAHSYDCERWETGCGRCPNRKSYPEIVFDNTRLEWKIKDWLYNKAAMSIVTPSKWLHDLAKRSMLGRFDIHHIPNGLDLDTFRPHEPAYCRNVLGIPNDARVVLYVATNLHEPMKGGALLEEALEKLPDNLKKETVLLTMGKGDFKIPHIEIRHIHLGYINNDGLKTMAYSAADVFAFASLAENLPLVVQESIACGTPVAAFKVGGIPEIAIDGQTGKLATLSDTNELASAIEALLTTGSQAEDIRSQCRGLAEQEFDINKQTESYINLYNSLMK